MIDGNPRQLPRLIKFLIDVLQYGALALAVWAMMKYPPP